MAVVCGIDPGLGITGYAVLSAEGAKTALLEAGSCRLDTSAPLEERLIALEADLLTVLQEHRPEVVAVEQLYAHYKHPRTAILMGHARGVILLAAARAGIQVRSYPATQVKRFLTGHGRASKAQVQSAIQRTLGLAEIPEPADVADAMAIALCCAADWVRQRPAEASV